MSIKERPLIKAVERLGPLPGFLFANMYAAGFFAIIMCPVFGGVFTLFWAATFGGGRTLEIFQAVHLGAIVGLGVGALALILAAARAVDGAEEEADRVKFVLGGLTAIAVFLIADFFLYGLLERYFAEAGDFMCLSQVSRCN